MNFLKKLTKKHLIIIAVILTTACLAVPLFVSAWSGLDSVLISISSWIAQEIIYVVGQLLLIAISILIKVAGFNEFVDAEIVKTGWVIVRDVANLAIVISLLIIAFYTVINKQSFHYKTMLPKLILAAILVNFSKSITGLLIDFGQIVMMYFVHAFEGIAAGNLTYGFGIEDMMSVRNVAEAQGAEVNDWNVFGALVLAVIMVVVALGVVVSMAVMLLARVITLWILIIFSPLAFVGALVPGLDAITGDWWDRLKKNIIFGPTLAFLFWLSMTVISGITGASRMMNLEMSSQEYLAGGRGNTSAVDYAYFASQVSSPQRVFDYMVTVGLLIMTLTVAQKAGVVGASVAGKWEAKMKGAGQWIAKRPQRIGKFGWDKAKTRAPATMVRALGQRMKTSKAGRLAGLDKEYTAQQAALRQGKSLTKWGGERFRSAQRSQEAQLANKMQEELKNTGVLDTKELALSAFDSMLKKGNKLGAQAVMKEASAQKWMTPKMMAEYQEKFGYKKHGLTSKAGEDAAIFEEVTWGTQDKAGDPFAKYKVQVERNAVSGKYETKDRKEIKDKVREDTERMKFSDVKNLVTAKNITGKVDENGLPMQDLELDFIKGTMMHEDQIGNMDKGKRKIAAS
ncbi:hypothetical protein KKA66_01970, partial [Patescibacteria group bacterium]|nr:hypothetical protein [Patescibacteria group bacterium]